MFNTSVPKTNAWRRQMNQLTKTCPIPDMPVLGKFPIRKLVEVTMMVPIDEIDFHSCVNVPDSIATDRGDEPMNDVDLSLATWKGLFIEGFGSYEDEVKDFFLEEKWEK